jgi:hypothetical protein
MTVLELWTSLGYGAALFDAQSSGLVACVESLEEHGNASKARSRDALVGT